MSTDVGVAADVVGVVDEGGDDLYANLLDHLNRYSVRYGERLEPELARILDALVDILRGKHYAHYAHADREFLFETYERVVARVSADLIGSISVGELYARLENLKLPLVRSYRNAIFTESAGGAAGEEREADPVARAIDENLAALVDVGQFAREKTTRRAFAELLKVMYYLARMVERHPHFMRIKNIEHARFAADPQFAHTIRDEDVESLLSALTVDLPRVMSEGTYALMAHEVEGRFAFGRARYSDLIDVLRLFVRSFRCVREGACTALELGDIVRVFVPIFDDFESKVRLAVSLLDKIAQYEQVNTNVPNERLLTMVRVRADGLNINRERFRVSTYESSRFAAAGENMSMVVEYDDSVRAIAAGSRAYDNTFVYGPFDRVFGPAETNADILRGAAGLVERLRQGESVCVIGYGTSGSGKTSTLIYLSYEDRETGRRVREPGLVANICDAMVDSFDRLTVSFDELYFDDDEANQYDEYAYVAAAAAAEEGDDAGGAARGWVLEHGAEDVVLNAGLGAGEDACALTRLRETLVADASVGGLISAVLDHKRHIRGTPNNPQSSRSHVLVSVAFESRAHGRAPKLIICDFAGVENEFNCADGEVLAKFRASAYYDACLERIDAAARAGTRLPSENIAAIDEQLARVKTEVDKYAKMGQADISKSFLHTNLVKKKEKTDLYKKAAAIARLVKDSVDARVARADLEFDKIVSTIEGLVAGAAFDPAVEELGRKRRRNEPAVKFSGDQAVVAAAIDEGKARLAADPARFVAGLDYDALVEEFKKEIFGGVKIYRYVLYIKVPRGNDLDKPVTAADLIHANKRIDLFAKYIAELVLEAYRREEAAADEAGVAAGVRAAIERRQADHIEAQCERAVAEGKFINSSLADLRAFVSLLLSRNKDRFPNFNNVCVLRQCSPFDTTCFGINYDAAGGASPQRGVGGKIVDALGELVGGNFDDLTICIFNVINVSATVNNPPPIPYVNMHALLEVVRKLDVGIYTLGYGGDSRADIDAVLEDFRARNAEYLAHEIIAGERIGELLDAAARESGKTKRVRIEALVGAISNLNALTTIGTMEFTDAMAKYGQNRTPCDVGGLVGGQWFADMRMSSL